MPGIARVVIPEYPHHVIHRGNRREKVFFGDEDKQNYLNCLRKYTKEAGVGDNREDIDLFTRYTEVGRPLGDGDFIKKIEKVTGRFLRKNKPGPKKAIK